MTMTMTRGRILYPRRDMARSASEPQALIRSTDNVLAAYLAFLPDEQVSAGTARLYLGHVHPHRFRHDTAQRLADAPALLGHSRLDTLRIYTQPDQSALERAAAALEQAPGVRFRARR